MLLKFLDQCAGMPALPITAPTMLPAVAAVQSLSIPMATVSPMTRLKSVPPIVIPQTVRQALLIVWIGCIPLNLASTAARAWV